MSIDSSIKNKILFILHLPPPIHGAALMGKHIRESQIKNFETDFINLATSRSLNETSKQKIRKVFLFIKIVQRTIKTLSLHKYNLCYMTLNSSGPAFYKDLIVVAILKMFRQKIIYHFHNKGVASNSDIKLNRLLYKFAFRNTKSILLSPNLYQDIQAYVSRSDVYFCANGIPDAKDAFQCLNRNINPEVINILFLSNMQTQKGVLVLLDACRLLKENGYAFECHFVGAWSDISERMFDRLIIEKELVGFVFSHGPKYGEDKAQFYHNADIFILPSFNEVFSLVNLEAMQHGLAVISTREGGTPDIIEEGKTGLLFAPGNENELADKIKLLINNSDLRIKMGVAGRQRFDKLFTLERFEKRIIDIFDEDIQNNPSCMSILRY